MRYLSFIAAFLCLFASPAWAKIAVVDVQHILSESQAAQDIQKQLDTHRDRFQNEFSKYEDELRVLEQNLQQVSAAEMERQKGEFEQKLLEIRKLFQTRKMSLDEAFGDALASLQSEILSIVTDIAEEEGYELVLSRQHVVIAERSLDITEEVMRRLDRQVTKIPLKIQAN